MSDEVMAYKEKLATRTNNKPVWERKCLTVEEAAVYSGIGIKKLRSLLKMKKCPFALSMGTQVFVVREKLDEYISKHKRI